MFRADAEGDGDGDDLTTTAVDSTKSRHVTGTERTRAFSKLQKFLFAVLEGNNSEEVAAKKATELASKFELHVFNNTESKEEYSKVILSRMQQVNDKRGYVASSISGGGGGYGGANTTTTTTTASSSTTRYLSLSPMEEVKVKELVRSEEAVSMLKEIDEMLRLPIKDKVQEERLLKFRNLFKRQRELALDGLFILSLKMVGALFEQCRLIKNELFPASKATLPPTKGDILLLGGGDDGGDSFVQQKQQEKQEKQHHHHQTLQACIGDLKNVPLEIEALKKIYPDFQCLMISLKDGRHRLRCSVLGRSFIIDIRSDGMVYALDGIDVHYLRHHRTLSLAMVTNVAWNLFINNNA